MDGDRPVAPLPLKLQHLTSALAIHKTDAGAEAGIYFDAVKRLLETVVILFSEPTAQIMGTFKTMSMSFLISAQEPSFRTRIFTLTATMTRSARCY